MDTSEAESTTRWSIASGLQATVHSTVTMLLHDTTYLCCIDPEPDKLLEVLLPRATAVIGDKVHRLALEKQEVIGLNFLVGVDRMSVPDFLQIVRLPWLLGRGLRLLSTARLRACNHALVTMHECTLRPHNLALRPGDNYTESDYPNSQRSGFG